MKDQILQILNMEDILDKYNIKYNHKMFCCPFHKDKTPSAKYYDKTFYCFGCNKMINTSEIKEYDEDLHARCPKCGNKSIIADSIDEEITDYTIDLMHRYWY